MKVTEMIIIYVSKMNKSRKKKVIRNNLLSERQIEYQIYTIRKKERNEEKVLKKTKKIHIYMIII